MNRERLPTAVQDHVIGTMGRPSLAWWLAVAFCATLAGVAMVAFAVQLDQGMGETGLGVPVMWGVYITSFVYFIGVSHSGTLISAILYLTRSPLRAALGRSAEAMTVIAIITAGCFPIIHLGRAWLFFWLIPYPNQRMLWVNFRSPLIWDLCAILSYCTTSALFLYLGMLPDLALIGRKLKGLRGRIYRSLSLGFGSSDREWVLFDKAYPIFAGLVIPLAVSVHSVVSWDFAMALIPGWHSTVFAPYFVAGAIFSGLAMAIFLLALLRKGFHLEEWIKVDHFDLMAKLMVAMSLAMSLVYLTELFYANFAGNPVEHAAYIWRTTGPQSPLFWTLIFCNSIAPLAALWRKVRRNIAALFVISIIVNIGMWLERYVIVVTSLAHSYEPYTWHVYAPSVVELCIGGGFFGVFGLLFLLFVKLMPSVSIAETMQGLLPDGHAHVEEGAEEPVPVGAKGWVLGLFGRTTTADEAVKGLRARGVRGARVQSPAPCAVAVRTGTWHWQKALPWLAFTGALLGLLGAIGLEAGTSAHLPIVVGGKPILSWPAFGVIFFEFTMLAGGLFTFVTTVTLCWRGRRGLPAGVRDDLAYGQLVVAVPAVAGASPEVAASLRELGAQEVYDEA